MAEGVATAEELGLGVHLQKMLGKKHMWEIYMMSQ